MIRKLVQVFFEEANFNRAKVQFARILAAPFPEFTSIRIRAAILRFIGFQIGRGGCIMGTPKFSGGRDIYRNLTIGEHVGMGVDCYFDLTGTILIGDYTGMGPGIMLITGTHDIGPSEKRTGQMIARPIVIGKGVWLGARCTVLPGVTIGDGAVIVTGALVAKDVPPGVMVGGTSGARCAQTRRRIIVTIQHCRGLYSAVEG